MVMGTMPCERKRFATAASPSASIVPSTTRPSRVRTRNAYESAIWLTSSGQAVELFHVVGTLESRFVGDLPFPHELREVLVHHLHTELSTGLHRSVDLVGLTFPDQVTDRRCCEHDLGRDRASLPVRSWK